MFISIPREFFVPELLSEGFRYNPESQAMEYDSDENINQDDFINTRLDSTNDNYEDKEEEIINNNDVHDLFDTNVVESFDKDDIRDKEFYEIPDFIDGLEGNTNSESESEIKSNVEYTDNTGDAININEETMRDIVEVKVEEKSFEIEKIIEEVVEISENSIDNNIRESVEECSEKIKDDSTEDEKIEYEEN